MAKPGGRNPGGRVAGRSLLGSGSKGTAGGSKFAGGTAGTTPPGVDMLNPSRSGNADVVSQRAAQAQTSVQLKRVLKKSKSKGLTAGGVGAKARGKKK